MLADPSSTFAARHRVLVAYAIFGGPVAWFVHICARYPLVPLACARNEPWLLHVVTLGLSCVALGSVVTAVLLLRGRPAPDAAEVGAGGVRALALVGLASSILFVLVIGAELLPALLQDPCLGVPTQEGAGSR